MSRVAFSRPRLLLSRCLELEACRYNEARIASTPVRRLIPHVELIAACPEVEIGLGVPRPPIRLVAGAGGPRLVQPSTGAELTERMRRWAEARLAGAGAVDGVVLKSRSPSCGIRDAKVYGGPDDAEPVRRSAGAFARVVLERCPGVAVVDEVGLTDPEQWHRFLTRIFASARVRAAREGRAGSADGVSPGSGEPPYPASLRAT